MPNASGLEDRSGVTVRSRIGISILVTITLPITVFGGYRIEQIADDSLVNRDPTISAGGIVAWSSYNANEPGNPRSEIFVYVNGNRRSLTAGAMEPESMNTHPRAGAGSLVWVGTFRKVEGDLTWVMKDPRPRPEGPEELDATYLARCEHDGAGGSIGKQWFVGPGTNPAQDAVETVITNLSRPRRHPSGDTEICLWRGGEIKRLTQDMRNDIGPSAWGNLVAWQKARGWPFGWEIMVWDNGTRLQLTTNYYYDLTPRVQGRRIVWYGWDGHDYEIYLHDRDRDMTLQITSNGYDDVSPVVWGDMIAWEGYAGLDADIYLWDGSEKRRLSKNPYEDSEPSLWNGSVVWQGFDGNDFEIFMYCDGRVMQLTTNAYDDVSPKIRDGIVCWVGYYDNFDGEIFVWDQTNMVMLTDNDYEDRNVETAGGRLVWEASDGERSLIMLAIPESGQAAVRSE